MDDFYVLWIWFYSGSEKSCRVCPSKRCMKASLRKSAAGAFGVGHVLCMAAKMPTFPWMLAPCAGTVFRSAGAGRSSRFWVAGRSRAAKRGWRRGATSRVLRACPFPNPPSLTKPAHGWKKATGARICSNLSPPLAPLPYSPPPLKGRAIISKRAASPPMSGPICRWDFSPSREQVRAHL